MRQLLPAPVDGVDPVEVYGRPAPAAGRPGVRLNMIASIDGATVVDGTSGALGGPPDRRVYLALRALADVVLVAAGTVRAEGYGRPTLPADLIAGRRSRGQEPLPRLAVVSGSLALDWEGPLFAAGGPRPIVVTAQSAPSQRLERAREVADVVVAGERSVDLAEALTALGATGAHSVLVEGGPRLNGQLAAAGLLDEVCLTLSHRLVGGDSARILAGPPVPDAPAMALASVLEEDGLLFLRYRRR